MCTRPGRKRPGRSCECHVCAVPGGRRFRRRGHPCQRTSVTALQVRRVTRSSSDPACCAGATTLRGVRQGVRGIVRIERGSTDAEAAGRLDLVSRETGVDHITSTRYSGSPRRTRTARSRPRTCAVVLRSGPRRHRSGQIARARGTELPILMRFASDRMSARSSADTGCLSLASRLAIRSRARPSSFASMNSAIRLTSLLVSRSSRRMRRPCRTPAISSK